MDESKIQKIVNVQIYIAIVNFYKRGNSLKDYSEMKDEVCKNETDKKDPVFKKWAHSYNLYRSDYTALIENLISHYL